MFVKNFSHISRVHISQSKRCFNVKSLTYYFHMKTKILTAFHICISVPLIKKIPQLGRFFLFQNTLMEIKSSKPVIRNKGNAAENKSAPL